MDWAEYIEGGIGAIIGSALTILGFRSRLDGVEKDCMELKTDTNVMLTEIRGDIKKLIEKTGERRKGD